MSEIPLIQKDISMLTEKFDTLAKTVDDNFKAFQQEAKRQQEHREESIKFHGELLEKLDARFAGKWTEKILIFVGTGIGLAIIGAIMALILKQ